MDDSIKTTKLSLSSALYCISPSALANRLWSSIHSYLLFHYLLFCLLKKREGIYGWFLEQPLLIAWTRGLSGLASFLDEGVASSSVHFSSYIYLSSFLVFSYFIIVHLQRELCYFENFALVTLLISLPSFFRWDYQLSRNHLLGKSPFPFLHFISHLFFFFFFGSWSFTSFREAVNLGT